MATFDTQAAIRAGYSQAEIQQFIAKQPSLQATGLQRFGQNIVSSGVQFAKDIGTAVAHPARTTEGILSLAGGAAQAAIPGEFQPRNVTQEQNKAVFEAVTNFYKQRYGSVEAAKKAAFEDPVGVAADVASILTGAGGALRVAGPLGVKAGVISKAGGITQAGQTLATAGRAIDPITNIARAKNISLAPLRKISDNVAHRFMSSALKPTEGVAKREVVDAALRANLQLPGELAPKGFVASGKGLNRVRDNLDQVNKSISLTVDEAAGTARDLKVDEIIARLEGTKRFYQMSVGGDEAVKTVNRVIANFEKRRGKTISVKDAQEIKQNTGTILRNSYGQLTNAEETAMKQIVRGLKEEINKRVPGLEKLNARDSELIALENALESASRREANKQIFGLTGAVGAGAVGAGAAPARAIGAVSLVKVLDSPGIKSRIARLASRLGTKPIDTTSAKLRGLGNVLFQAGRVQREGLGGITDIFNQAPTTGQPNF